MYKIVGADGKEYGPVSTELLRQWIGQTRVNRHTKIKAEGATEWQTLGELREFAAEFAAPSYVPPTPGGAGSSKTSGMAIASLVLGILGLFSCGMTALVGLVLGIVALVKIKNSQGRLSGSGLATAGVIVSALFLVVAPVAMLLPALAKAKQKAQTIQCLSNTRQLCLGVIMFTGANTNQLPPAATWCDAISTGVTPNVFICPGGDKSKRCHYAFNANLDGIDLGQITSPATTVVIFESDGDWNSSGGAELLPSRSRHGQAITVGFADGHAEVVKTERLGQLRWKP